jgi:hypothetical protein
MLPLQVNRHISKIKKVVKSEIELGLPFLGPDLVCKFQMICLKGTKIIDRKSNAGHMDRCTYRYGKKPVAWQQGHKYIIQIIQWIFPSIIFTC